MTRSVKPPLALKRRVSTLKQLQKPNFSLGYSGESLAQLWLSSHGLRILDHNLVVRGSEIDILAFDTIPKTLRLFEVKTRSSEFIDPTHAVSWKKTWRMWQAGEWLVQHWQTYCSWLRHQGSILPPDVIPEEAMFTILSVIGSNIKLHTPHW